MLPGLCFLVVLFVAGCGGERSFEPGEFVDKVNAEGAGLTLGEPLTSIEEGVDVFQISFAGGTAPIRGEHGHAHEGGSMIVAEDASAANEEFERCEAAVSLTCYRAANVVLYFNAEPTDEPLTRVERALRALARD